MSEDKRSRRRFLADLLFAGGALSAAALAAKSRMTSPKPIASATPAQASPTPAQVSPTPQVQITPPVINGPEPPTPGLVAPPIATPEPVLGGKPAAPEPAIPGKMKAPRPHQPVLKGDVAAPLPRPKP